MKKIHPLFKKTPLAFAALLMLLGPSLQAKSEPERQVYAHYMGCYPAGGGGLDHHIRHIQEKMDPQSNDFGWAMGGGLVNLPLTPQDRVLSPAESAELEIKRAIRGGINGFAVDAWAGKDGAKATLDELFAAAERLKVPFGLTICLDHACLPKTEDGVMVDSFADAINWLIERHGNSPNLARRDGKVLVFGYSSHGILRSEEIRVMPQGPEKWAAIADAYRKLREKIKVPLYFHYDMDNMVWGAPDKAVDIGRWAAENFEAVGGFLGTKWGDNPAVAKAVKEGGAEWSQPLIYQYNNKGGSLYVEPGTDMLRKSYQAARDTGSTLMQFVTWNDYGEDTILAPGYSTNYTILTLNRYLSDWWKTGAEPKVEQDQVHLIFRRALNGAPTFPFAPRRQDISGVLEIATILKKPGKVTVSGYPDSYEAPAGLFVKQFPLKVGPVSAKVTSDSVEIVSVTAPEQITDKPFREDNTMACFSSNFLDEWKTDFGDTPPLLYSENGDADGDGLPNWFEMLYFGQFPYMDTATAADPSANPDDDKLTNLQEYNDQSDPLKADEPYPIGFVWDLSNMRERGFSLNPDHDSYRHDVWFYLYRNGETKNIPHDGKYLPTPISGHNVPYAGKFAHLSPSLDPEHPEYKGLHGWIAHRLTDGGVWQMVLRPHINVAVILGWRSPVDGVVSLSFQVAEVIGQKKEPFVIDVERNHGSAPLESVSVLPGETGELSPLSIPVKKGDFVYLFAHGNGSYGYLENLNIKLVKNDDK